MLKKLFGTFMILLSSAAFAADILIVKAGSKTGTSAQRNNIYAEVLQKNGYTVNLTDSLNNELALEMYNNAQGPALLVWGASLAGRFDLDFTESEFMAIEYSGELYICTINADASKATGTIALDRPKPRGPVSDLGYTNFIPYKNSTDVNNAGIAGEVDFVVVNKGGYTKMTELGKTCDVIPGLDQTAYVVARNVNTDEMRKAIRDVLESTEMKSWQEKKGFTNPNATFDYTKDYNFVKNQIAIWSKIER
jgi:hypothetical protein